MPKGNPSAQTMASERYQKKIGMVAKTFKLKKELCDEFKSACDSAGVSQAAKLSELMQQFIDSKK